MTTADFKPGVVFQLECGRVGRVLNDNKYVWLTNICTRAGHGHLPMDVPFKPGLLVGDERWHKAKVLPPTEALQYLL